MGVGVAGGRGTPEGEAWLEEVEDVENSVEAESTIAQVRQFFLLSWVCSVLLFFHLFFALLFLSSAPLAHILHYD